MRFYKILAVLLALCLAGCSALPAQLAFLNPGKPAEAVKTIKIYSALDQSEIDEYLTLFAKEHPDVKPQVEVLSTWNLVKRVLAEKSSPQADVVWGLAATAMLQLEAQGVLEPLNSGGPDSVTIDNLKDINPRLRDRSNPPYWLGMGAWVSAICVNRDLLKNLNQPEPKNWEDLLDPVYRGQVMMPNPDITGVGFLWVSSWLQYYGEDNGWKFMDELHKNVKMYTNSGSTPCKKVASGEILAGITYGNIALDQRSLGPIDVIFPEPGLGWEVDSIALVRKPVILDASKTFINWGVGKAALSMYAKLNPVTSIQTDVVPPEGYPLDTLKLFLPNRFLWSSANYDRIVAKWLNKYQEKAESGSYDLPQ
jgi:iron(III) transport system substrate-binding protein